MSIKFSYDTKTTRYRPQNAYWMARISKLAYVAKSGSKVPDEAAIIKELRTWDNNFTDVKGFSRHSSQSFVARHEDMVVAAFRGTDQWADWLDNLNLPSVHRPMGRVHRGFQLALDDVWPDMLKAIDKFTDNGQSLWITGHSLGGALATLAAAERIDGDQPFFGVYTYGQPRCGDRDFARHFNIEAKHRFFRFQNNNDIVSRIPQRLMGYSHLGTILYIDVNKKLNTDIAWWYRFTDRIRGDWQAMTDSGVDWLEDHKMQNYVAALAANVTVVPAGL